MAYKMILNKEKFLKTEFGGGLQECIAAWDMYLTKLSGLNYQPSGEYAEMRKGATWCQAQWEVYKAAMKQFYSIEYNFTRTDNYYGVCTEDETDWLFKCYRSERQYYRVFLKEPTCVSGPFTAAKIAKLDEESDADLFGIFTADEYKATFGLEVAMQL